MNNGGVSMALSALSMRGERDLWIRFTNKCRFERIKVWDVLKPFILKELKRK